MANDPLNDTPTAREKLRLLRLQAEMTQAQFAEKMGVALRTLQDLETGKAEVREVHLNAARWAVYRWTTFEPAL